MASDNAKRATAKYNKSHYDAITFRVSVGGHDIISAHAAKHDSSTNAFLLRAIVQTMQDDGADPADIAVIRGSSSGR